MADRVEARSASPIVVAGMHRSGTSLVASWLAAAGIDMGERLLPSDAGNPTGYFEDVAFLDLDRRMLQEAVPEGEPGHRDWGWTESGRLDCGRFAAHRDEARELIARCAARGGAWGWKDPRTTLLLDFWHELLPDAGYLLLYRFPWEVADSMQRLGKEVFLAHPDYAYRIWSHYNRHLLDFCARHRERCLLLSVNALLAQPQRLPELLASRFGLSLRDTPLASLLSRELFARVGGSDPLVSLVAACHPEATRRLAELDAAADLSGAGLWQSAAPDGRRLAGDASGRRTDGRPIDLSIVIPCHDDGELLIEAVASAERSAPPRCELLIVNDGSTDRRTLEILEILRRTGYAVIDQENRGLGAARNRGVEAARGRYLLPLDADNRLSPGFPAAAIAVLDARPEVGVVYGDRREFGLRNVRVAVPEFDLDGLLRANFIDACSMLRREVWEQCGGYDASMPAMGWEDWDLWICAAERGWRFHRLPDVAFEYRVRPSSMATGLLRAEVGVPLRLHMIDKHWQLYRQRLPSLLTAQHERQTLAAELAAARAEQDALRAERDRLAAARTELEARVVGAREELAAQITGLHEELRRYRERVAFQESTRAWRLRAWILALRKRLGI